MINIIPIHFINFKDINLIERLRIMNDKLFPLYLTTVEKVKEGEIIETLKIADKPKKKGEILSFMNDKYFPYLFFLVGSLSDLVTKP